MKSKDGSNDIQNRASLCSYHEMRKSNRRENLADYRTEIADREVDDGGYGFGELINLAGVHHEAIRM